MSTIAVPESAVKTGRRGVLWIAAPVLALLIAVGAWLGLRSWRVAPSVVNGTYYTLQPITLDVNVTKDGELQAIQNIDILSQVEGQTTVTTLVKEGASVKKGEVLITLDSSQIKQRLEDATLEVQRAGADLITAQEMREIQQAQNDTNLESAQVELLLAQLDIQQYEEGVYPQQLANAQTDKKMADINLTNKEEDLQQARNLFSRGFVTAAEVKKAELDVTNARNALDKSSTSLTLLEKYTHQMDLESKKNSLAHAKAQLVRTQRRNTSEMAQREMDLKTRQQMLSIHKRRQENLQKQLESCTIEAPADGMVVYGSSGDRWNQNPLQEGAQVRERQMLIRLPDTTVMKAVVRIQESQISKLKEGMRATVRIVGVPKPVGGLVSKISVLPDNSQRWWNPDLKEYPIDVTLDETPPNLKPGTSVVTEISIEKANDVLAVPLTTIYASGKENYVFLRQPNADPRPVLVTLGRTNDTHAEIVSGVVEGDEVLMLQAGQGRELAEKAGIKVEPTTRPNGKRDKTPPDAAPNAKPAEAAKPADAAKPDGAAKPAEDAKPAGGSRPH